MKRAAIALSAVLLVACLGLGGWHLLAPAPAQSTAVAVGDGDSVIRGFGLLPEFDLEDLVAGDNVAVLATVERILGSDWNQEVTKSPIIHTNVVVRVDRYLGHPLPYERLCIRVPGGRIGDHVMVMEGAHTYTLGEQALLFLYRPPFEMQPVPRGFAPEAYFLETNYGKFILSGGKAICPETGGKFDLGGLMHQAETARQGG